MNRTVAHHPGLEARIRRFGLAVSVAASLTGCGADDPLVEPPVGFLNVSNATTGGAFDPDGFGVRIDEGAAEPMEVNDSVAALTLSEGSHTVHLSGLAANCSASEDPVQHVDITGGETTRLEFAVTCTPPPELASIRIVFARSVGNGTTLVAMNADGSGEVDLMSEGSPAGPDVSPDGSRILFTADQEAATPGRGIYVMNADGSGVTLLVAGPASDPRWSPDGREIVYIAADRCCGAVHVAQADGSGGRTLTGYDTRWWDSSPAWSPDGTRIAFTRIESPPYFDYEISIWAVDREGTEATRLTPGTGEAYPVWSSTDGRIAFASSAWREDGIRVMNGDGSGLTTLLATDPHAGATPWDWSRDGRLLLFTRHTGPDRSDVFLLRVDEGAVARLTADGGRNSAPAFR